MKWEYVRVVLQGGSTSNNDYVAPKSIWIIGNDGQRVEWKKLSSENNHSPAVSRLLEKLGDDEWELTMTVPPSFDTHHESVFYFKRPKP